MPNKNVIWICLLLCSFVISAQSKKEFSVLLLGQTGAGKSTLINIFYNHMNGRAFEDTRDIVVPLLWGDIPYVVNVAEFQDDSFKFQKPGRSQTDRIRKYVLENDGFKVTFWDAPGFLDTRGWEQDEKHLAELQEFLTKNTVNSVAIVLTEENTVRVMPGVPNFQTAIDDIRRLLPKSSLPQIVGIYTRFKSMQLDDERWSRKNLSIFFESDSPGKWLRTFLIDGSIFFAKDTDSRDAKYRRTPESDREYWEYDRLSVMKFLEEMPTGKLIDIQEINRIRQLKKNIEESTEILSRQFQLLGFKNSGLKILEAKNGDFSKKIKLCKKSIEKLEAERKIEVRKLANLQAELAQLAMKTNSRDAYILHLEDRAILMGKDQAIAKQEKARRTEASRAWKVSYDRVSKEEI